MAIWPWSAATTAGCSAKGKSPRWSRSPRDSVRETPSKTPGRRGFTAVWRGCTSPRPRSSCTGRRRNVGQKKVDVPGAPLPLRLVVTEVRDTKGRVLARWLLLTNMRAMLADAATIARWYYFRWRIESMHKLLKSAGWQLEGWLQAKAIGS